MKNFVEDDRLNKFYSTNKKILLNCKICKRLLIKKETLKLNNLKVCKFCYDKNSKIFKMVYFIERAHPYTKHKEVLMRRFKPKKTKETKDVTTL